MIAFMEDTQPTLEQAQAFVGGYVEMVSLPNGDQMLVNEEGLMRGMAPNMDASRLAGTIIVGPALVLIGKARWD